MDTGEPLERPFDALSEDALRLLRTFEGQEVRFLIVGGYAVRVHGYLRPVADLDLLIDTREQNLARLLRSLEVLRVTEADEVVQLFRRSPKARWRWGKGYLDYYVDLLTALGSFTYDDLAPTAVYHQHEKLSLPVISKQQLIEVKQIVCMTLDRTNKDLDDIRCLMGLER